MTMPLQLHIPLAYAIELQIEIISDAINQTRLCELSLEQHSEVNRNKMKSHRGEMC